MNTFRTRLWAMGHGRLPHHVGLNNMFRWEITDERFLFKIPATEHALLNFSQSAYSNYEPDSMNQMKIYQGKRENALCDIGYTEGQNMEMLDGNRNVRKLQQFIFAELVKVTQMRPEIFYILFKTF